MAKPMLSEAAQQELLRIARQYLFLETLETRKHGSLDFKEQAVWCIRDALEAAYLAGMVDHYRSK
ncbi:DUF6900 domain-containing protein [Achromobacter insolitus]|uniref:DUF6900 domain-containing protein n=1 Tax=Achromobacter insolitus TaxID=217204 RepID=UPI000AA524AC|nr:hypothetical protein [Achromobacter insolitus]